MTAIGTRLRSLVDRKIGSTALVLIYHRVASLATDPQLLAVTPENFDAQMRVLAEHWHPISVASLAAGMKNHRLQDRSVAVTFDDGYADNLTSAAPVLERHRVPATMFVSSGYAHSGAEFWWDELERLVLGSSSVPASVTLSAEDDAVFRWDSCDPVTASDPSWNVLAPDTSPPHVLYRQLHAFLRPLTHESRGLALAQLRGLVDDDGRTRATHRPLTAEEVRVLDCAEGIDVGGHTIDHEVLSALTLDAQKLQISKDRATLAELCGHDIGLFSYPYGGLSDYTDDTVAIVQQTGYAGACSNHPGIVKPWTNPYRVPRLLVRNWDAEEFTSNLESWFHGRF